MRSGPPRGHTRDNLESLPALGFGRHPKDAPDKGSRASGRSPATPPCALGIGSAIAPSFGSICNRPTSCALRSRRQGRRSRPCQSCRIARRRPNSRACCERSAAVNSKRQRTVAVRVGRRQTSTQMDRAPADRRRFQRVGDAEEDVWGASEHGQLRAGTVLRWRPATSRDRPTSQLPHASRRDQRADRRSSGNTPSPADGRDGGCSHAIDQARSAGFLQVIKTQIYGYPEARKAPARERSGALGRSGCAFR